MDCFNTSDLSGPGASYDGAHDSFDLLRTSDLDEPDNETLGDQDHVITLNTSDLLEDDSVEFLQEHTSTPKTVVSKILNTDVTEWFDRNVCDSIASTQSTRENWTVGHCRTVVIMKTKMVWSNF